MRLIVADALRDLCVSLDAAVSIAKTEEPIEVPFVTWTREAPGNHILGWSQISPPKKGAFGGMFRPVVKHGKYKRLEPKLDGRQRCGLLLSVLQQLIAVVVLIVISASYDLATK